MCGKLKPKKPIEQRKYLRVGCSYEELMVYSYYVFQNEIKANAKMPIKETSTDALTRYCWDVTIIC